MWYLNSPFVSLHELNETDKFIEFWKFGFRVATTTMDNHEEARFIEWSKARAEYKENTVVHKFRLSIFENVKSKGFKWKPMNELVICAVHFSSNEILFKNLFFEWPKIFEFLFLHLYESFWRVFKNFVRIVWNCHNHYDRSQSPVTISSTLCVSFQFWSQFYQSFQRNFNRILTVEIMTGSQLSSARFHTLKKIIP